MSERVVCGIDAHALTRAFERGTNDEEVRKTIALGECFPAKQGRSEFRRIFTYNALWAGKYYKNKQLHVFAAEEPDGWYAITVIVKFF